MRLRHHPRRWALLAGALAVATGAGTIAHAVASPRGLTTTVSAVSEFEPADHRGVTPTVSDDGRWVVFAGLPPEADDTQAATGGTRRTSTVYLRDRQPTDAANAVVELTQPGADMRLGDSVRPVISGDGCVVVTVTEFAYDLFRDDDDGSRWDVYRLVLPHCGGIAGDWELVSTESSDSGGTVASDLAVPTSAPSVSRVGSVVAYTRLTTGTPGADRHHAVTVVDLTVPLGEPGRSIAAPGLPIEPPALGSTPVGQHHPDLSADGRWLVFESDARADQPVPTWSPSSDDQPAPTQVYVWDRAATAADGSPVTQVSLVSGVDGVPAAVGASAPVISASGRYIAFESASADLAGEAELPTCATACPTQVYRYDQLDDVLVLASRMSVPTGTDPASAPVVAADGAARQPAISADGSQVAFVSGSRTLFPTESPVAGGEPGDGDIVVVDMGRGTAHRVSVEADGVTPLAASSSHPALSGSGHVVVFDTLAGSRLDPARVLSGDATGGGRHVALIDRPAQLDAASLDVGTVVVGFDGPEWYTAVRNLGPSTFTPVTVTSSDAQFRISGGTCGSGLSLAPGESCTVNVILRPSAPGPVTATLTVADTLPGGARIEVPLAGAGGMPDLRATPAGADFPSTLVGTDAVPLAFDVENIGFGSLGVSSISFAGRHPDDFTVLGTNCLGETLLPMNRCFVEVAFRPRDAGVRSATLVVAADAGRYTTVVLSGEGRREARLQVADTRVRAGDDVGLGGSGFPAGAEVTIGWSDGRGATVTVTADEAGAFLAVLPTRRAERSGDRTLVARSADVAVTVDVQVVRRRSGSSTGLPTG